MIWVPALRWLLLLCLLFGLSADRTHQLEWLLSQPGFVHLYQAARQDDQALQQLVAHASVKQRPYWLSAAIKLGSVQARFELAELTESNRERQQQLRAAAQQGHVKAQYELGIAADNTEQRQYWLSEAARQGHLQAQIALYQWWLLQDQYKKALPWLQQAAQQHGQSALILAKLQWRDGQHDQAKALFTQAQQQGAGEAAQFLKLIQRQWRKPMPSGATTDTTCRVQVQPVATSLLAAKHLDSILNEFTKDRRLAELPICVNRAYWPTEDLGCSADWQGEGRLGCDLAPLHQPLQQTQFSHLLVVAEQGKANVNNGVMFLDIADNYHVFVHELAHFAGFVDEYPLSEALAEQICRLDVQLPNLLIVDPAEPTWSLAQWQDQAQPIQLTRARTCNNHPLQAYKASDQLTFMEYYDTQNIPPLYLQLWRHQLETSRLIPAYVNLARALEQRRKFADAEHWWQQMQRFREQSLAP